MPEFGLRPLSVGEILDRTFTLYRRNFFLFVAIFTIPQLLVLALNLYQTFFLVKAPAIAGSAVGARFPQSGFRNMLALGFKWLALLWIARLIAYVFSQGAIIHAASEVYLGRTATVGASLRRIAERFALLLGVAVLHALALAGGFVCLIIPFFYVACRLIGCFPAALLEDLGPGESLTRSFRLTEQNAGRAFLIYLLYFVLIYAAGFVAAVPFGIAVAFAAKDPALMRLASGILQIAGFFGGVLVGPFQPIAATLFYYDLRVRKEAFDLQVLMQPSGSLLTPVIPPPL